MSSLDLILNVTPSNCSIPFDKSDGVLVGNGKIGIITGLQDYCDVTRVVTTRDVVYANGQYQPNVIDTFIPCRVSLFNTDVPTTVSCCNLTNTLIMENGVYNSVYQYQDLASSSNNVQLSSKLYALRHMPYTILQTLELTPLGSSTNSSNIVPPFDIFHEVYTKQNMVNVEYNHTFVNTNSSQIYQFYGHGTTADGVKCAFASAYLVETGNNQDIIIGAKGASRNMYSTLPNAAFYQFRIENAIKNTPFKLHILTTLMTDYDFPDPGTEARNVSLAIASSRMTASMTLNYIISKHVTSWTSLWQSRIKITPKMDIPQQDIESVYRFNKLINVAMYNIYASVRENFNVDLGDAIPFIDMEGSILYDGDLWLVPLLLIVKPTLVRPMLEYRYKNLGVAQRLAASYGNAGAKYPFVNDILGYRNNLYFTSTTFTYIYNTALVSVNTWNYYRVSRDYDWLKNKGYSILQNIAQYISSVATLDDSTNTYYFAEVVGLNGTLSSRDHAFTNNLAKLALRYAIEASYEVRAEVPDQWVEVYEGLTILKWPNNVSNTMLNITKYDYDATLQDTYTIVDVLFNYMPAYWEEEINAASDRVVFYKSVKNNLDYYASRITTVDGLRPVNVALQAALTGVSLTQNSTLLASFNSLLQSFIDNVIYGPWYYMRPDTRILPSMGEGLVRGALGLGNAANVLQKNSLHTNAMFLAIIYQGLGQLRLVGGVSENRFHYVDFKIAAAPTAVLPSPWAIVSFQNMGMNGTLVSTDTRQSDFAAAASGSNDPLYGPQNNGSSGIYNFHIYTP